MKGHCVLYILSLLKFRFVKSFPVSASLPSEGQTPSSVLPSYLAYRFVDCVSNTVLLSVSCMSFPF